MDGRIRVLSCSLVWLALTVSPTLLLAQPDAGTPGIRIARLIDDLGSRSYVRRAEATAKLETTGSSARVQLQSAAQSKNPEVRLRAVHLLRKLHREELWTAGQVTLSVDHGAASDMILAIAEHSGNRVYLGDNYGKFNDGNVKLPREGEFWPLMDSICQQSGHRVRPSFSVARNGLVVVAGARAGYPVAYSGPIRAQVTLAKRRFAEDLDFENSSSKIEHKFLLNLLMTWEDRFRLVAARSHVELIAATTANGDEIKSAQADESNWNVFDSSSRQFGVALPLEPPSASAKKIKQLEFAWDVIAIGQMAKLAIEPLTTNQLQRQDDASIVIHQVEHLDGSRWEIELSVRRDLPIPDPQEVLFRENRFELLDEAGNLMRQHGRSHVSISNRAARYKMIFRGESETSHPTKLVVHYPTIRDRRQLRFVLTDVPLPVATPE